MARVASRYFVRVLCGAAITWALALALPPTHDAAAAGAPAMLVATRDPALLAALDATFSPRGVRVLPTERPLHATSDDLAGTERTADLVWLCDLTPVTPSSVGPRGETALCVRPYRGTVIIRRIAVATPLSSEDAASLALSVEVALMPDTARPPHEEIARRAPPAVPSNVVSPEDGAHRLTLELGSGARSGPDGTAFRASVAAIYAPRWLGHHLGIGAALAGGPTYSASFGVSSPPGRGGPGAPLAAGNASDLTLRIFARGQERLGPVCLQLDLGPEAHVVNRVLDEPDHASQQRLHWSLDSFVGAVVPFGRFFAGARAGGSYLLTGRQAPTNPTGGVWNGEALATIGVGWF